MPNELEALLEEFTDYQLLQESEIPVDVWNDATVREGDDQTYHRMDVLWHH